jgi:hypothetical protein
LPSPGPSAVGGADAVVLCVTHSAELFVKSYLTGHRKAPPKSRTKNHPEQSPFDAWLKHDLARLLVAAVSIDLQLPEKAKTAILDIAKSNVGYELRFQDSGTPVMLPPVKKEHRRHRRTQPGRLCGHK